MTVSLKEVNHLIANGYEPIPVVGKRPAAGLAWQRDPITEDRFADMLANSPDATGIGLRTGFLSGVDIDLMVSEHVAAVTALAVEMLGPTPCHRIGSKGDLACYQNKSPIPKIVIKDKDHTLVEIFGTGGQFVGYGEHPMPGVGAYRWVGDGGDAADLTELLGTPHASPLTIPLADLPEITPAQLWAFAGRVRTLLIELGYEDVRITGDHASTPADNEIPAEGLDSPTDIWRGQHYARDCAERGDVAVAGHGGHDLAYQVSAVLIRDLGLSAKVAADLMLSEWYPHCSPSTDPAFVKERCQSATTSGQNKIGSDSTRPAAEAFTGAAWVKAIADSAGADLPRTNIQLIDGEITAGADLPRTNIQLIDGEINRTVDTAEAALINHAADLYTFGNLLIRPGFAQFTVSSGDKDKGIRLITMTKPAMLEAFNETALFWRWNERAQADRPKDCPDKVAEHYLAREGKWKLRKLAGVIHTPTLRQDGSILETPGYDVASCLLYDPLGQKYPVIPQSPTKDEAVAALALYKDLLKEFPFVDRPSLSVALSAFLTSLVRRNLDHAPLHGLTAPSAGTGKSLLVDCVALIATGKCMPVIAQGASEEETEKRIVGELIIGSPFISLDNCTRAITGSLLCQILTQETVRPRILGVSKNPDVLANMMILANGNNLTIGGDLTRRVIMSSLDAHLERPELRHFSGKPDDIIRADRGRYVVAALTVLRAFIVAGSPSQTEPLGSYDEWSTLIRDALVWCGEADPCDTMDALTASDPEREDLGRLLHFWNAAIGTEERTTKKLIATPNEMNTILASTSGEDATEKTDTAEEKARKAALRQIYREASAGLHDALGDIAGRTVGGKTIIDHAKLGRYLGQHQGQVINGLSFVKAGITDGTARWKLRS